MNGRSTCVPETAGEQMRIGQQIERAAGHAGGDAVGLQRGHRRVRRLCPTVQAAMIVSSSSLAAPGARSRSRPRDPRGPSSPASARHAASSVTAIASQASSPAQRKQPCGTWTG